jgi:hypothetical protein
VLRGMLRSKLRRCDIPATLFHHRLFHYRPPCFMRSCH